MAIHIFYSLTEDDFREYQQTYLSRAAPFWERIHFRVFVIFGVIVFVAGLNWIFFEHRGNYPGYVAIAGGLYLIFAGAWGRLKWTRWFRINQRLYQDLEVEISGEDLTTRSRTAETSAQWDNYSGFIESDNLVALRDVQGNYVIMPKRAFGPGELESFVDLLRIKLGDAAR